MKIISSAFEGLSPAWKKCCCRLAERLPGKRIGVAVSGGGDSVALIRILQPLHETGLCTLVALHVDHGWRPESASEALWVRDLAARMGVGFCGTALTPPGEAGGRISEASARAGRFAAFAAMAARENLDAVALGHTADDQCETLLMRLLRGTSLQGLGGIRERRRVSVDGRSLLLWRPLLRYSRAELRGILKDIGQDWLEDPSNESPRFLRNRIRNEVVPLLDALRPGVSGRVCALAEDLQAASQLVRAQVRHRSRAADENSIAISERGSDFLLRETIRHWLIDALKIEEPSRTSLDRLAELVSARRCGRGLCLHGRKIVRTREGLALLPIGKAEPPSTERPLMTGCEIEFAGWRYLLGGNSGEDEAAGAATPLSACSIWIDSNIYLDKLMVRTRSPGDRFRPAGGAGGKKLARWLIDRHVPRHQRDGMTVIACGTNIVWIPGMAVAEGVSTTPVPGWLHLSRRKKAP